MTQIATDMRVLIVVSVMFLLSLFGAYVLFKLLKSSALIKKAGYRAGGALAGFLLLYSALSLTYTQALRAGQEASAKWTVTGTVERQGSGSHGEVEVSVLPPPAQTTSRSGGLFRLENVATSADELPEIQFYTMGYHDFFLQLDKDTAEVDYGRRRINLKQPVVLYREADDEGMVEGEFQQAELSPSG